MVLSMLAGYSEHLNWRPIDFVNPPDSGCSVCGVLAFRIQLLPCSHRICLFCYQSGIRQRKVCPLDQKAFDKNRVKTVCWFEKDRLAQLVRCTNAQSGCDFEGTLSDWLTHFARKCEFHNVTCKKCAMSLVRSEMKSHLQSCRGLSVVLKGWTRRSITGKGASQDVTSRPCRVIEEAPAVQKSSTSVLKNAPSVVSDALGKPGRSVDERKTSIHSTTVYVEDMSGCKDLAREAIGGPTRLVGPIVVGGYYMRLHVCLSEVDVADWKLMFWLEVCVGPRDAFLRWPLDASCSVLLKRPKKSPQPLGIEYQGAKACGRPNREKLSFYFANTTPRSVAELEAEGFLVNDALEVSIELAF